MKLNKFRFSLCFLVFSLPIASLAASNATPSRTTTPSYGAISGGLAGTGLSSVDPGESYIINPGAVAHLRGAAVTFGTSHFQSSPKDTNPQPYTNNGWHLSLNENSPDSAIATSIFINKSQKRDNTVNAPSLNSNDAWLTLGNFVIPNLAAGLSYHFRDTQDYLKTYQEHNFSVGFLWSPIENIGIGFSFLDFNSPSKEIPAAYAMGSSSGLGVLYIFKDFLRLRLDYTKKDHKLESQSYSEVAFGLETTISEWALSRIGVAQQKSDANEITQKYSLGLGFSGPRFGIHYAFQQYQLAQHGKEHNLDLIIPF
jgi:hypothetical protein